jgi:hypothetical protein
MALAGLGWLAFLLPAVPNYLSIAIKVVGNIAHSESHFSAYRDI